MFRKRKLVPNFCQLPSEMKEMIVQRCTKETRNALKATARCTKKAVEKARLNFIGWLILSQNSDKDFQIRFVNSLPFEMPNWKNMNFNNFEDFQKALTDILKNVQAVMKLSLYGNFEQKIQLAEWTEGYQKRLLVRSVEFKRNNEEIARNVLSQLEPIYLKKISEARGPTVFGMPQITNADEITIRGPIEEDQLLKLNARSIELSYEVPYSLQRFIEKCLSRDSSNITKFVLYGRETYEDLKMIYSPTLKAVFLETSDPRLKLKLSFDNCGFCFFIKGAILYDCERTASDVTLCNQLGLRTIEFLNIVFIPATCVWRVEVRRKYHHNYEYELNSIEEFQEKIGEILENTDCIKMLAICLCGSRQGSYDENPANKIRWAPRINKLVVTRLSVFGNHSITSVRDLLDQIDPNYMRYLEISSEERDETLFDVPHVYTSSEEVSISGSVLRPDQLLKINSRVLNSGDLDDKSLNQLLTASDINQYIKKRLTSTLNQTGFFEFSLGNVSPTIDEGEVLDGLDIISTEIVENGKILMINSTHRDYILQLKYLRNGIYGRVQHIKSINV